MKVVSPKTYLLASTALDRSELDLYLNDIGDPGWFADPRVSDAESLIEAAGRMCYRSWAPWDSEKPEATNQNVTKVREGNNVYLANIVRSGHGAVLEHANFTFIFRDVSRVFTHELVRHRAGMAYSQESLRYVRLKDLRFWLPDAVDTDKRRSFFEGAVTAMEGFQGALEMLFGIDRVKRFAEKKKLTSMFRRLAPIGLATSIMATGNARAWRHVIRLRTDPAAEEEIRLVFDDVAAKLKKRFPHLFFDMNRADDGTWVFENESI